MDDNPYETPQAPLTSLVAPPPRRRNWGLHFVLVNAVLLLLFPPIGCPCCYGALAYVILPYWMALGFPTILAGWIAPEATRAAPGAFLAAFIVNVVLVSYFVGRIFPPRRPHRTQPDENGETDRTA